MKRFIAATLLVMSLGSVALAEPVCLFGQDTGELTDNFDLETGAGKKVWYKHEDISLSNPDRINGLSKLEKQMVASTLESYRGDTEEELLADFSSADGYLTYFAHGFSNREFVIVASYPGDNEYGKILEIKRDRTRLVKVIGVAANIGDGEITDCGVTQ